MLRYHLLLMFGLQPLDTMIDKSVYVNNLANLLSTIFYDLKITFVYTGVMAENIGLSS